MPDNVCPKCGRVRTWTGWRSCECGYDFGLGAPTVERQSESADEKIPVGCLLVGVGFSAVLLLLVAVGSLGGGGGVGGAMTGASLFIVVGVVVAYAVTAAAIAAIPFPKRHFGIVGILICLAAAVLVLLNLLG